MKLTITLLLLVATIPASAHSGHAPASSFMAGLLHPLIGIDHLLAMLGIGLWSRLQNQPITMPATFITMMALGALIQVGMPVPEAGLAASVCLIGALVAAVRLPANAAIALVGMFALLHGQAHGRELPELASAAGYLLSSAALLMIGRSLGSPRLVGTVLGGAGLCLLAGLA